MKLDIFVLLSFLSACGPSLTVSSIDESKVESYSVTRGSNGDIFTVKMKDVDVCDLSGKWCTLLSAYVIGLTWKNGSSCSCNCLHTPSSFLPPLQTCVNTASADTFGGEYV